MEFNLRHDFARYFLPPDKSIAGFIQRVQANSLAQALEFHRDGMSGGVSIEQTIREKVDELFDDSTSESQEDEALALILSTWRADDIVALINNLTWDNLDDELDEQDLNRIAAHCHDRLDHRDYRVAYLMRWFYLREADTLRTLPSAVLSGYAASLNQTIRGEFAWECIQDRNAVLDGIGSIALRGKETFVRFLRFALDAPSTTPLPLAPQVEQISWEAHYTDFICHNLEQGEFSPLLAVLPEMFEATPAARGRALFDMLIRWDRHFAAMESLIAERGSPRQKDDMRRFMRTRKVMMDLFPAAGPPPGGLAQIIQEVMNALQLIGNSLDALRAAIFEFAGTIQGINAASLLGSADNQQAVATINRFAQSGTLALLPTSYKLVLVERAMSGWVEDDEEQAVLTVLRSAKEKSPAEFMQMIGAITWERLFNDFNGSEYDELEAMFRL